MWIEVKIEKNLGNFRLNVEFKSDSRRIGILGASGCGKSMTLKCIAGIAAPDAGQIQINKQVFFQSGKKNGKKNVNLKPQRRRVGYLFQNYALFPTMTVAENISAGFRGNKKEKLQKAEEIMEKFRLSGLKGRFPRELSGGQQQRTALARIMACEPEVILLDEPFSALDEFLKDYLQQELMEMLKDYQGTVILVSHNRDEIYRFSEELLILDEGRVICQGKTKEIFANPCWVEAARLTGCKNITRAERIDKHKLYLPGWGITLELTQNIQSNIRYAGIRAHDLVPVWRLKSERPESTAGGEREGQDWNGRKNCIPVFVSSKAELPFERKYFLKSEDKKERICWFVQRDDWKNLELQGMPDYLEIPEKKLLLLQSYFDNPT